MYKGVSVALITPFNEDLSIDYTTLEKLIDFQIGSKVSSIVALGTTAETVNLTDEEYEKILKLVVEKVKGTGIKVIVGTGSNSTIKTIEKTKLAKKLGADCALVVCPYYNKPSQKGMLEHFKMVANSVDIDIILYNIPSRTGVRLSHNVIEELSKIKNIVGIKDATGDILETYEIKRRTNNFTILSGDDGLYYSQLQTGCTGVISVIANVYPKELIEMTNLYFEGKNSEAFEIFEKMYKISEKMFIEGNPATLKAYMKILNIIPSDAVRPPLSKVSKETIKILEELC